MENYEHFRFPGLPRIGDKYRHLGAINYILLHGASAGGDLRNPFLQARQGRFVPAQDARFGRWLSQDPLGFNAGDVNLGRYLKNHAADSIDPTGLEDVFERELRLHFDKMRAEWFGLFGFGGTGTSRRASLQADISRVLAMSSGDPETEKAIWQIIDTINQTPDQGRWTWRSNKCFNWVGDFLERFKKANGGRLDLANGKVIIEPLEVRTVGDKIIVTSYVPPGGMTAHGFFRVTIRPGNGGTNTAYFDLGSSTNMGNYGGDDHWFFDDTPNFRE